MRTLQEDISDYHRWLRTKCEVDDEGLRAKRKRMRESAFAFLRATYFRWAATIEHLCPDLAAAARVACIGDIHVENFGTWRDAEGRLVWGVNDFDEVATMPYAYDLARLATSALLAPGLDAAPDAVVSAILDGYRDGLTSPRAALPDENAGWLRPFANPTEKSSRKFWSEIDDCADAAPPPRARDALTSSLPADCVIRRFAARIKGGGSLGRPRYIVVADWNSGRIVREAKACVPSAWNWAHSQPPGEPWYIDLARGSFRSPDPFLRSEAGFTIRRIAPDSRKIELDDVGPSFSLRLLSAMSADLAAVHVSDPRSTRILADLAERPSGWLARAAATAGAQTRTDFADFRASVD